MLRSERERLTRHGKPIGREFRRIAAVLLASGGSLLFTLIAQGQQALLQARRALEAGRTQEAVQLLEDIHRSSPDNPQACLLLGIAYGNLGDNAKSLAMFKQFAHMEPARPEAYNNLGAAYLRLGDAKNAEDAFRHAVKLSPSDSNGLYNLGALLNAKHSYVEARPLLERAFRSERSVATAYELAVSLAGAGDRKKALQTLSSVHAPTGQSALPWMKLSGGLNLDEGNVTAAAQSFEKALAIAPEDEQAFYGLATAKIKSNHSDQALLLLDSKFSSLSPSSRHLREGTFLASAGAQTEALALFEQAAAEDPNSFDAFYNLAVMRLDSAKDPNRAWDAAEHAQTLQNTGEICVLLGDIEEARGHFTEALNHYQQAVRLDPDSDTFVFDLGAELLQHENYQAAQSIFLASAQRLPKSARIYVGLGAAQFLGGNTSDSVDSFLKAVDLDPQFQPAYLFLGQSFPFAETRSDRVIAKLAYIADRNPADGSVQYYYGAALVSRMKSAENMKDSRLALATLQRAAELQPKDARVYYQLGELCTLQKQLQAALLDYQKAVELDPNFPEALYKLGQTYVHLGRHEEAKKILARHQEAVTKSEADLYHRSGEIQSFVLKIKNNQ
jgi:tetratricopeptide (TPR) repeat protein